MNQVMDNQLDFNAKRQTAQSITGIGNAMNMMNASSSSVGQVKKAKTILTPHLEAGPQGSMLIVLDNQRTSHPINEPITGKIKVHLHQPFDVNAITLSLAGFQRSFFDRPGPPIGA